MDLNHVVAVILMVIACTPMAIALSYTLADPVRNLLARHRAPRPDRMLERHYAERRSERQAAAASWQADSDLLTARAFGLLSQKARYRLYRKGTLDRVEWAAGLRLGPRDTANIVDGDIVLDTVAWSGRLRVKDSGSRVVVGGPDWEIRRLPLSNRHRIHWSDGSTLTCGSREEAYSWATADPPTVLRDTWI